MTGYREFGLEAFAFDGDRWRTGATVLQMLERDAENLPEHQRFTVWSTFQHIPQKVIIRVSVGMGPRVERYAAQVEAAGGEASV